MFDTDGETERERERLGLDRAAPLHRPRHTDGHCHRDRHLQRSSFYHFKKLKVAKLFLVLLLVFVQIFDWFMWFSFINTQNPKGHEAFAGVFDPLSHELQKVSWSNIC